MAGTLTADWTMEQSINRTVTVTVDSGTHAGNQVPVAVFRNILPGNVLTQGGGGEVSEMAERSLNISASGLPHGS